MSKRDPLRKLMRKFPPTPEIDHTLEALEKDSDITIAIVGIALLEGMLEQLLTLWFREKNPNLLGLLFNNRGPLSDFHSKILIANAWGVMPSPMASDFHSLKAIRNTFAHAKVRVDFNTPAIANEIESLGFRKVILGTEGGKALDKLSNKQWFVFAVRLFFAMMQEHVKAPDQPITESVEEFLGNDEKSNKL